MVLLEALVYVLHMLRLQNFMLVSTDQVFYVRKLSYFKILLIRKLIEYLQFCVVAPDCKKDVFFEILHEEEPSLLLAGGDRKEIIKFSP